MNNRNLENIRGTVSRRINREEPGRHISESGARTTRESTYIDEDGVVEKTVTEYGICDCGCAIKDISEVGGICGCGKILCKEHFYHCESCGRGICAEERRVVKGKIYCRRCFMVALLKSFVGVDF